jgi:2,3-dihydroxyphenylpropionate 1,2-dioxygenase
VSEIVIGVGASHSTLMNTHWDRTVHPDRAERFRDALHAARDRIAAARPDTAVIIGSNHFRGFWLDLIPAFTIGVGEVVASGESGTPKGPQQVDRDLATHLAGSLLEQGFDPAFSARLQIDHGQTHAIQYLLRDDDGRSDVAIVPVVVNMFAPPLPTPARCHDLGKAIGRAVAEHTGPDGTGRRVAVIASGGLSHRLPWPKDWQRPEGEDEEFMVEAWLEGRAHWSDYDARRREIILAAEASINGDFDREFLARLENGDAAKLRDWTTERIEEVAGNGAQEIRSWLALAGALGDAPARTLAYEPMPEWLTGMAVSVVAPVPQPATDPNGATP